VIISVAFVEKNWRMMRQCWQPTAFIYFTKIAFKLTGTGVRLHAQTADLYSLKLEMNGFNED